MESQMRATDLHHRISQDLRELEQRLQNTIPSGAESDANLVFAKLQTGIAMMGGLALISDIFTEIHPGKSLEEIKASVAPDKEPLTGEAQENQAIQWAEQILRESHGES